MSSGYIDLPVLGGGGGGSGTVTSVAVAAPATLLTVSGSPVTSAGTITLSLASASGNKVLASPADGSSGAIALRILAAADIPNLDVSKLTAGTLPIARGGTNSAVALSNNRVMISSSSAFVEASAITASRALASDSNGIPVAATTTATELGYVNGVTSAIQTQINTKAPSASPTFSGTITTPLTASRAVVTGSSSELAVSATTAAEIAFLSGVQSSLANSEYNAGNSSTAITLNFNNGPAQLVTLTGNCTITLSNGQAGASYAIRLATGAGSFTVAWTTVTWSGATAPVVTTTASRYDLINLYCDGTKYYGSFSQNYT